MCDHENARWGKYVEWVARRAYALTTDRGRHLDARTEDGEPVEIKACIRRTRRGDPGRFFIRESNHRALADAGGYYLFAVYDPQNTERGPVLEMELKPAAWLDGVDCGWMSNGSRRGEVVKRPPWGAVFARHAIPGEDATVSADNQ